METEIVFVADASKVDVAEAAGIPTRSGAPEIGAPCPFQVGDSLMWPASPNLAYRVVWRLFSFGAPGKGPVWMLGIVPTEHPLNQVNGVRPLR